MSGEIKKEREPKQEFLQDSSVENLMLREEFEDSERKREKADFLFTVMAEYEHTMRPALERYIELASKIPEGPKEDDDLRAELLKVTEALNLFSTKLADGHAPFSVAGIKKSLEVAPDIRYSEAEQVKRYGGDKEALSAKKSMDTWEITMARVGNLTASLQEARRVLDYLRFTPPWGPHDRDTLIQRRILRGE